MRNLPVLYLQIALAQAMSVLPVPAAQTDITDIYVPGDSLSGVRWHPDSSGTYRFTIAAGAWSPWSCDASFPEPYCSDPGSQVCWGWTTRVWGYIDRSPWSTCPPQDCPYESPYAPDFGLDNGCYWTTAQNAEAAGVGMHVDVTLDAGQEVILLPADHKGWYDGNRGGVYVSIVRGVAQIEVVDPNPELIDQGDVAGDPNELASGGRLIVGLAGDGVTCVLVRAEVGGPGSVEFRVSDENGSPADVGTLSTPGGREHVTTLSVSTVELADGRHMAFAVLTAPEDFVRAPADENLVERPINIDMTFTPDGGSVEITATRQIDLVRPPVMLLHGLWSDRDTWTWALVNDPRFTVCRQDYRPYHADHFVSNVRFARWGVARAVEMLREQGIAATQADVFGHSMGGLLSRMYIGNINAYYIRNDNFGEGDIHKLITVDTPHLGSPLAVILMAYSNDPLYGVVFNRAMRLIRHCVDCGAVEDLQPSSDVLSNLPGAEVQAHAIVGVGGSDILQAGMESLLPAEMSTLLTILRFFGVLPEDLFPPELQHDFIVGRISQEGGLGTGSSQTSVYGLNMVPLALGIHTTVTAETRISDRAVELLNAQVNSDTFASEFPPRALRSNGTPLFVLPQQTHAVEDGIQIVSPLPGTPVTPGAELSVTVQGTGGFVPVRVMVVSDNDAAIDEEAPFDVLIDVPANSIGEVRLGAFAFDAKQNFAEAVELLLQVDVGASLTGISVGPEMLYLFAFAPTQAVTVMGTYDDGVERDLTPASLGTTYETSDPEVATVDAEGVVTGHRVGSTIITATNGAHMGAADVVVVTALADYDRDGDVDLRDFAAFMKCFSGGAETPAFLIPQAACRDFFDTDADFDVDLEDYANFEAAATGPNP